ncbi:uncharacterized protein DFL_003774 [Arthrobotrys flagrans]|uniref:Uncharacterized protein n=1 Tax=Arthrobotrys flagrans TaxID=97331 RepID=A0A437A2T6_ARTFL|nr:hypothetical protein DFL_003774 [Arthrobotrys flagrans]
MDGPSRKVPVDKHAFVPITQLLFDCDNTLVRSEEIAFDVCAELINDVLSKKSPSTTTKYSGRSLQSEFVGQNFAGMLRQIEGIYKFTLSPEEREDLITREVTTITKELGEKAKPCDGANEVLEELKESGKYGFAVVSSSAGPRVLAALRKAGQMEFFDEKTIFSAMTSLPIPTSKPDPAIYKFACRKLGRDTGECIAVEDSVSGVKSAVAGGIKTVGYLGAYEPEERGVKGKQLESCGAGYLIDDWKELEGAIKALEGVNLANGV